jgi:tetratricopeptide (TPR) repeat protein
MNGAALPDPGTVRTLGALIDQLRRLKIWAGNPSYDEIRTRINAAWLASGRPANEQAKRATVADCFNPRRRRLDPDLVLEIVQALHRDVGYLAQWRQALRVVAGEAHAAAQVRAQDTLPADTAGFTGRVAELNRLRTAIRAGSPAVFAVVGMAGIGKTRLAIHAGHLVNDAVEQVLFVDLRGFHPDQPPADPAAVLDSFLRLLGMSGHQIPHGLAARAAEYRQRLAARRTLVVLDNAADEHQVEHLLPGQPGTVVLMTSRRSLPNLAGAIHLPLAAFTTAEARRFLRRAAPLAGPATLDRIAGYCGHLPLALALVEAQIRARPGWSATDHADRLDERRRDRRLDSAVDVALTQSYLHLPAARRRLFRLLALHPGPDLDVGAAAALAADAPDPAPEDPLADTARHLVALCDDHLLQQVRPGRFGFHDLVRAYATGRSLDDDRPVDRTASRTRLFEHYLTAASAATGLLFPAEHDRAAPGTTPANATFDGPEPARRWLHAERINLTAVSTYAAAHGWPSHAVRLSTTLFQYLDSGGYPTEALVIHHAAREAARAIGDRAAEAGALNALGCVHGQLGRYDAATGYLQRALALFRRIGDRVGEARTHNDLGGVDDRLGRYRQAVTHRERALELFRQADDRTGEGNTLTALAATEERVGHYRAAAAHLGRALTLARACGDLAGEAWARNILGDVERGTGQHVAAQHQHGQALALFRRLSDRFGEATALTGLGAVLTRLGRPDLATVRQREALALLRDIGDRDGEAVALNGLGEAAQAAGRPGEALDLHQAALAAADETGVRDQQARAHTGLAEAYRAIGDYTAARSHATRSQAIYTELGIAPDAAPADLVTHRARS